MTDDQYQQRRRLESLPRGELRRLQLERLNALLETILPANAFYAQKLTGVGLPLGSLEELDSLPFTFKSELLPAADQPNFALNLTWPLERYTRFHQTSGSRGRPLVLLDTPDDWRWWIDAWQFVLDAAELTPRDRALMAFSFGPFVGFWSAFDAVAARGGLAIPAGGLDTLSRLRLIDSSGATVVFCTPSYALRMAEVADEHGLSLAEWPVRALIVAGEPGGSVASTRRRIETAWGAKLIDHAGATEVGPWGYADRQQQGLHVNEAFFLPEFLSLDGGGKAGEGELAELVLTNLGRSGAPLIRYRTGDLVKPVFQHGQATGFVLLEGGVLGRADDMLIIRGVNIYPSAIEQILREFPEIAEFRLTATRQSAMDHLEIEIEDSLEQPRRVAEELQARLGLRIAVRSVPPGQLPRFEAKAQRFVDLRRETS